VQVTGKSRAGEQARIEQRGVVEAILQHAVALPNQCGDDGQVGHVASGKQQRTRPTGERGQRLLQFMVWGAVANDQVRCTTADAPLLSALLHRANYLGVIGQAEVVVGTERQQLLTISLHLRPLRGLQQRTLTEQIGSLTLGQASSEIERHYAVPVGANAWANRFAPTLRDQAEAAL
jgi:hypothetical protein